ncbi:Aldehyde dehydrogenase, thermostable [archaeon HR01]|nr:Aldehyde dehydrogenase, thermostable [archaeon HR01]
MPGHISPCIVGGEKTFSSDGGVFRDVNPADIDDVVAVFPALSREDVRHAIDVARDAASGWAAITPADRGKILVKAAEIIDGNLEDFARTLTREEGKTLAESRAEVARSASILRFYGVMGYRLRGEITRSAEGRTHLFTVREPLGVVSIITPWNFPIAIPAWKIAPALVCGNTVVFKPASYTPLIAYMLADALHRAGLPPGVLNFVTGGGASVGMEMISNPKVAAISFTGSLLVGEEIKRVSAASNVRVQLELGGKNPAVVLDDADMEKAVEMAVRGAFGLTGQACTATSRVIVHEKVLDEFTEKLLLRVQRLRVGNGLDGNVDMGPVVGEKEMNNILQYIRTGVEEGARLLHGGERLAGDTHSRGYFLQPTVFTDVTPDMKIAQEEIFGPVLAIMRARNFDEAVDLANKIEYGLSASIFTRNLSRAFEFVERVEAGVVKINKPTTGIELHMPFGGFKKSSWGMAKEQGESALDFYTRVKTVYLGY